MTIDETNSMNSGQQGAALVTVVILLFLMLAVSSTIVYVTVLSNTATVDVVAEKQAFDAAQAGMQLTLNILRGNDPGDPLNFRDAATRTTSNKPDDWFPRPRLSNWLNYTYPAGQPDRVPLTSPYDPYSGLAFSVEITAPDALGPDIMPTPNPSIIDGPVTKSGNPPVKPPQPAWHPFHCGHCHWDYTHCTLYNPPNNGTMRTDGFGCRHKHCVGPKAPARGYERLLVRVTGFGPQGARQELELMVSREIFAHEDQAMIFLRGSQFGGDLTFSIDGTPKATFDSGDRRIAFAMTNVPDYDKVAAVVNVKDKVTVKGKGDDFELFNAEQIPGWLANADATRKLVRDLELDAKYRNRWFTSYPTGNAGAKNAPALTFVSGNATLTSDGNGILVVTGELTINDDHDFDGLILLLGGGTLKVPSGKGRINGAMVVARYGATGEYLGPVINLSGTSSLTVKYDDDPIATAMTVVNVHVEGVRER